jgi:hypothetical protein
LSLRTFRYHKLNGGFVSAVKGGISDATNGVETSHSDLCLLVYGKDIFNITQRQHGAQQDELSKTGGVHSGYSSDNIGWYTVSLFLLGTIKHFHLNVPTKNKFLVYQFIKKNINRRRPRGAGTRIHIRHE